MFKWLNRILTNRRVSKIDSDVVQLRAEFELFKVETMESMTDTLQKLSKRLATKLKRQDESEEKDHKDPKDPFQFAKSLNKDQEPTKLGL